MIELRHAGSVSDQAWDGFFTGKDAGVFYSSAYRRIVLELLGCRDDSVVALDGGTVRGVLPLMSIDGPFGTVYNSMPYYGGQGGVVAETAAASSALTERFNERLRYAVAGTIVPNPLQVHPPVRANMHDRRFAQLTDLRPAERPLLERFETRARGGIKRAKREGVKVFSQFSDEELDWFVSTHESNMRAIGAPAKDRRLFDLFSTHLAYGTDWLLWTGWHEGRRVAGALVLYFNGIADYYSTALTQEGRPLQAQSLVVYLAMLEAAARGCRLWNWGSYQAGQDELARFKRQWAAFDVGYDYLTQVNDPDLLKSSPERLLEGYPHFYVLPFSALSGRLQLGRPATADGQSSHVA